MSVTSDSLSPKLEKLEQVLSQPNQNTIACPQPVRLLTGINIYNSKFKTNLENTMPKVNEKNELKKDVFKYSDSQPISCYMSINDYQVVYYTGVNIVYYKEYHAKRMSEDNVSFPLNYCDPISIAKLGSIQYFFTSAIEGCLPQSGQAYYITDPAIQQIVAVRARASNGHWAQIYIGFNMHDFKTTGYQDHKAFYEGKILAIQCKNTQNIADRGCYIFPGIAYLDSMKIALEVKQYLINPLDFDWKSPVFKKTLEELLVLPTGSYFNWETQTLLSFNCYWTKDENKLKHIKYGRY